MSGTLSKPDKPILFVFGGLPGTGKSTLASALACKIGAAYIRIDTIEQAVRSQGLSVDGPQGYLIAYSLAADSLRNGLSLVSDSVNPLEMTRKAWRDVAEKMGADVVEIEVICSESIQHRTRIETRTADVEGLTLPTWQDVNEREYDAWSSDRMIIDTANHTPEESRAELFRTLQEIGKMETERLTDRRKHGT